MTLIPSRRLALDSAHWNQLAYAAGARSSAMRDEARAFPERLLEKGYVLTLAWAHVEEVLALEDDDTTDARLAYLTGLPLVSWIGGVTQDHHPGSLVEIAAAEVMALRAGVKGLTEVRDHVRGRLFRTGSGRDMLGPDDWVWQTLRPAFIERNREARRITALAPARFIDGAMTLGSLMEGRLRSRDEALPVFAALARTLGRDIAEGADQRIEDPDEMARRFLADVAGDAPWQTRDVRDFVVATCLARGLDEDEITPDLTIERIGDLSVFRGQLRTLAEALECDWEDLRRSIRMEDCPHWVIEAGLRRYRQAGLRRSGSDLNDSHLAVLAAYVDRVYVDKRVAETFRRARAGSAELAGLIGEVGKAGSVFAIPDQLSD